MLFRSRAILFPIRTRSTFLPSPAKYASTCSVIGTSSSVNPNFRDSSCAWSRDSPEEDRYGVNNPRTFSAPSAKVARATVTALSTPPETPTTPPVGATVSGPAPKRDPTLMTYPIDVHDGDGGVRRVEPTHGAARCGGAETAAPPDAAAWTCGGGENDRPPRRGVEVRGRDMPQVL